MAAITRAGETQPCGRRLAVLHRDGLFWLTVLVSPWLSMLWLNMVGVPPIPPTTVTLAMVLLYPVLEEVVFRGLLQGWLLERHWGRYRLASISVANVLTTALFCLLHLPRGGWLLVAGVMLPSLVLGVFRERYNHLLPPLILHIAFNGSLVLSLLWLSAGQ